MITFGAALNMLVAVAGWIWVARWARRESRAALGGTFHRFAGRWALSKPLRYSLLLVEVVVVGLLLLPLVLAALQGRPTSWIALVRARPHYMMFMFLGVQLGMFAKLEMTAAGWLWAWRLVAGMPQTKLVRELGVCEARGAECVRPALWTVARTLGVMAMIESCCLTLVLAPWPNLWPYISLPATLAAVTFGSWSFAAYVGTVAGRQWRDGAPWFASLCAGLMAVALWFLGMGAAYGLAWLAYATALAPLHWVWVSGGVARMLYGWLAEESPLPDGP